MRRIGIELSLLYGGLGFYCSRLSVTDNCHYRCTGSLSVLKCLLMSLTAAILLMVAPFF